MKKLAGLLGAVLLLAICSPLAQGAMTITVGGVACPGLVATADLATCAAAFTVNGDNVLITGLSGFSNSPGTPALGLETSATSTVTNIGTTNQTITIVVSAPDFSQPTAPPPLVLLSHIGGSVPVGDPSNTLSYSSCVNTSNSTPACPGSFTAGPGTPNVTGLGSPGGSYQDDKSTAIASLSPLYSMGETITITLSPGSVLNFSASSTLTAVPEPASVLFLGTTLLGAAVLLRKKFKRA